MKRDRYADENARRFDPQWKTELPSLQGYLVKLGNDLQESEISDENVKRERRRRGAVLQQFHDAVQAISLDLYRAHLTDPLLEVGIGVGTTAVHNWCSDRYGPGFLSARTFVDAVNALLAAGLIELTRPHWDDPTKQESRVGRYQASPDLLEALDTAGASVMTIHRREDAEGIILKGEKNKKTRIAPKISYGDVTFANEARDRLNTINQMLLDHWADLVVPDADVRRRLLEIAKEEDKKPAYPPDFSARTLHRVFNNSDWDQGGRFNGAWWINCPSDLRPYIVIDGKQTVEVDYSGLHAAMLFAEAGMDIPNDPYERCLRHTRGAKERKLVKLTFNALLNADSVQRLTKIEGYNEDLTGLAWDNFKRFIVKSYPEFKHHFGSGVGLRLQRKDSDLAETVMLKFSEINHACLPIHDSFIVHHGMKDVLISTMKAAFKEMFGAVGEVTPEVGEENPNIVTGEVIIEDIAALLSPSGHDGRLQAFRDMRGKQ